MTSNDAPVPSSGSEGPDPAVPPVLAEVVRSGFLEGRHRGSLVLLAADGSVEYALGDPAAPVFPRSSNKPMQAAAILRVASTSPASGWRSPPRATPGRTSTSRSSPRCWPSTG